MKMSHNKIRIFDLSKVSAFIKDMVMLGGSQIILDYRSVAFFFYTDLSITKLAIDNDRRKDDT